METLTKAEFLISVDSLDERYDNQNQVSVKLIIDYENNSYEIIPPSMKIFTNCKLAHFVSEAINLAYDKAMYEFYGKKNNCRFDSLDECEKEAISFSKDKFKIVSGLLSDDYKLGYKDGIEHYIASKNNL